MSFRKIFLSFSLILSAFCLVSFADTVTQKWSAAYNDSSNKLNMIQDIGYDASGNVYVTGTTSMSEIVIIKYNALGDVQWSNPVESGIPNAMAVDSSGNVYIAGQSSTGTANLFAGKILKYNTSGTVKWTIPFQGTKSTGGNLARDILVDSSGNVYVLGEVVNNNTETDYIIIKYNSLGTEIWKRTYNSSGNANDLCGDLAIDSSGNVYATGSSGTLKYNASGSLQWTVETSIFGRSLGIDSSSNIYIFSILGSTSGNTFNLFKYNSAGVKQWSSLHPNSYGGNEIPSDMAVDNSGNVYLTGGLKGGSNPGILTVKFDNAGVFQWDTVFYAADANNPGSVSCDPWTGVYVTGVVNHNILTIKYDSDGNEKWNMLYSANLPYGVPIPLAIQSGHVYVGGSTYSASTNYNFATISYDQHFCKEYSDGDINKDCKINFLDFAQMAIDWAQCNKYPPSDCQ
jgi:outer membrane protein assembly factor BamB